MDRVIVHPEQIGCSTRSITVVTLNIEIGLSDQLRIIHKNNTLRILHKNNT